MFFMSYKLPPHVTDMTVDVAKMLIQAFIQELPGLLQCSTAQHHRQSSSTAAICPEYDCLADHSDRSMRTHHIHSTGITQAVCLALDGVQDRHTGAQDTECRERLGTSTPDRWLQVGW